jgi:phosphatidylglycerophosphate synthase
MSIFGLHNCKMYSLGYIRRQIYAHNMVKTDARFFTRWSPYSLLKAHYYVLCASLLLYWTQTFIRTPNFVTGLYILSGVFGAFLLNADNEWLVLFGVFLVFNKGIFDWWDGALARLLERSSSKGAIFDPYGARICDYAFRLAIIFYALADREDLISFYPAAVFFILVPNIRFYAKATGHQTIGTEPPKAVLNLSDRERTVLTLYKNYLCFLDGRARSVDSLLLLILLDWFFTNLNMDLVFVLVAVLLVIRGIVELAANLVAFFWRNGFE